MGVCRRVALRDRKKRAAARGLPRPANILDILQKRLFQNPGMGSKNRLGYQITGRNIALWKI